MAVAENWRWRVGGREHRAVGTKRKAAGSAPCRSLRAHAAAGEDAVLFPTPGAFLPAAGLWAASSLSPQGPELPLGTPDTRKELLEAQGRACSLCEV